MKLHETDEYNDPKLYDFENDSYQEDIELLSEWAAKIEGPIIDLACGTGRATIPLAKEGHILIGVDVHSSMLNEAKRKAAEQKLKIKWIKQDCSDLNLNLKSKLIFSVGNSFQHFLTNEDQDGFLSSVYRHLDDEGWFIFGTRFPSVDELLQPQTEEYWKTYTDKTTDNRVDLYTNSINDPMNQLQQYITIRKYSNPSGENNKEKRTLITLRYVFPKEMERLLKMNSLQVVNVYGDWKKTALSSESRQMVYICKKSR
jgi:ubiquinone/menaquinone biosynthesis C-methylase UbiE